MKSLLSFICILAVTIMTSCDLRNETAKRGMEKFISTPTPPISPTPEARPIAPYEVITVDVNLEGEQISINGYDQKKTVACTKFNRVKINGDGHKVTITGACRQVMINGDRNEVIAHGAMEFVFNGSENLLKWSHFVNGKEPVITKNLEGNRIEKVYPEDKEVGKAK